MQSIWEGKAFSEHFPSHQDTRRTAQTLGFPYKWIHLHQLRHGTFTHESWRCRTSIKPCILMISISIIMAWMIKRKTSRRELSSGMRGRICRAAVASITQRKIAEQYNVPKSTVHDIIKADRQGRLHGRSKPWGAKRKTSGLQDQWFVEAVIGSISQQPNIRFKEPSYPVKFL